VIIVIGLVVVGGYGVAYWGICLLKGKDVSLAQMFNPFGNYPQFSGPFSTWPDIPDTQVLPGGAAAGGGQGGGKGGGKGKPAGTRPGPGHPDPHGFVQ
jgi:hypothetical protein